MQRQRVCHHHTLHQPKQHFIRSLDETENTNIAVLL